MVSDWDIFSLHLILERKKCNFQSGTIRVGECRMVFIYLSCTGTRNHIMRVVLSSTISLQPILFLGTTFNEKSTCLVP